MSKPTIAQLEDLLDREEDVEIEILPNGEIRAKGQSSSSELGGKKPLTMREDLGGEYAMDVQRILAETTMAARQFAMVEVHPTAGGGVFVKAALQTSTVPTKTYIIEIDFVDYPSRMPRVYVTKPKLVTMHHQYKEGYICYLHPNMWNPGRHNVTFVLARAAKWLAKYEVWLETRRWPGAAVAH